MPGITPSSPINASGTVRGLVSTVAQTFAGVKTFLAAAVFSAGVQLALLFNTNGSGAADVVVKLGTTLADASTNAAARLLSVRAGIGGTEQEWFAVTRNGIYFAGYTNGTISCSGSWIDMGGLPVRSVSYFFSTTTYGQTAFYSTGGAFSSNNRVNIWSENAAGAGDVAVRVGPTQNDATINAACILFQAGTALAGTFVEKFAVEKRGVYVNDLLEVGGATGVRYLDSNVAFTVNTSAKTWLYNCYEGGSHRSSLTRQGRSAVGQGAIAAEAQGASHHIYASAGVNEPTLRVYQRSTHTEPIVELWDDLGATPVMRAKVETDGTIELMGSGVGVVMKSPDGTRWRLTINNAGAVVVAAA